MRISTYKECWARKSTRTTYSEALEAAGCRGFQAVCASCGRQASCKASQLPCFLPPARTRPVCPWGRYQGQSACSRQRRALHLLHRSSQLWCRAVRVSRSGARGRRKCASC
ncbi:uncharacterized protein LOC144115547 [Amblyomma americanum]